MLKHFHRGRHLTAPCDLLVVGNAATSNPAVPRKDLFITTKILFPPSEPTVEKILPSLRESVKKMCPVPGPDGKPYVDLFLIHTPSSGPEGRMGMWKALIEVSDSENDNCSHIERLRAQLQKMGEAKDIGVSNLCAGSTISGTLR